MTGNLPAADLRVLLLDADGNLFPSEEPAASDPREAGLAEAGVAAVTESWDERADMLLGGTAPGAVRR